MEWTRRPLVRVAALAASVFLVVTHAPARDGWFWVGLVLVVLNVLGLLGHRRGEGPADPASTARHHEADEDDEVDAVDVALVDLLHDPAVAAAWATAPAMWQQVAHLDDPAGPVGRMPATQLAEFVWLVRDGAEWQLAVGDEVKPYLDLDAAEGEDAVLQVLRAHPAVVEAWHEDREVYVVQPAHELDLAGFAQLAARALAAGQLDAASRLP